VCLLAHQGAKGTRSGANVGPYYRIYARAQKPRHASCRVGKLELRAIAVAAERIANHVKQERELSHREAAAVANEPAKVVNAYCRSLGVSSEGATTRRYLKIIREN
jgi:hypothetical protein